MAQSLQILMLLFPGLIAKETTVLLGNVSTKRSTLSETMQYLIYSIFSLIPAMIWNTYATSPSFLSQWIISIVGGIVTGASWYLLIRPQIKSFLDRYNIKRKGSIVLTGTDLITADFDNKKQHLVSLKRNGYEPIIGFIMGKSGDGVSEHIIKIASYPEYKEWLAEYPERFPVEATYINLTDDYVLTEYKYPEGFDQGKID